eukprot:TRINITY_DN379_c0_g1_i2.p1 TRINITY_DN379_c0_g1~~TRINITY_DN379_c0_g1_i2.p1  ORF type:complete len:106 (+),score=10.05 TRINITY_DN379_c0_g1_i2:214-531(+)
MIEEHIQPKTPAATIEFIQTGGKLRIGGDVLVGLKRWETLVSKPEVVDQLLANMPEELESALASQSNLIKDVPTNFTARQCYTALGYQQKGMDLINDQIRILLHC